MERFWWTNYLELVWSVFVGRITWSECGAFLLEELLGVCVERCRGRITWSECGAFLLDELLGVCVERFRGRITWSECGIIFAVRTVKGFTVRTDRSDRSRSR